MGQYLQRLAQARALVTRQRESEDLALVDEGRLSFPDVATDVDDLAGPSEGILVRDPVEAFNDLGPRGTETEVKATVGECVDPRRGHGDQRRRAREDVHDSRADL